MWRNFNSERYLTIKNVSSRKSVISLVCNVRFQWSKVVFKTASEIILKSKLLTKRNLNLLAFVCLPFGVDQSGYRKFRVSFQTRKKVLRTSTALPTRSSEQSSRTISEDFIGGVISRSI